MKWLSACCSLCVSDIICDGPLILVVNTNEHLGIINIPAEVTVACIVCVYGCAI